MLIGIIVSTDTKQLLSMPLGSMDANPPGGEGGGGIEGGART